MTGAYATWVPSARFRLGLGAKSRRHALPLPLVQPSQRRVVHRAGRRRVASRGTDYYLLLRRLPCLENVLKISLAVEVGECVRGCTSVLELTVVSSGHAVSCGA